MATHGPWAQAAISGWFTGKTIKAMLVTSDYVEDPDLEFRSSITDEVAGTGYTAGGVTISAPTVTYDTVANKVRVTVADIAFGTVTLADIGGIVLYHSTGSAGTDKVIAVDVFGPDRQTSTTAEPFVYSPHGDGFVVLTIGAG